MKWQDAPAAEQVPTWQQAPALQEPQLVPGLRAPEDPTTGALRSAEKALRAYPQSAAKVLSDTVTGIYQLATSPVQTSMGMLDVAAGALRNMAPAALRKFLDSTSDPATIERIQQAAQKAGGAFAERYGSNEAIINTLETDPAGALADISFVLGLGGATAPGRIGASLTRASRIVDPMSAPIAALDLVAATPKAMMARPERRASNILQQTLGPERFALEDAMQRYPHLPPAEAAAAAGIVAPEFYALAEEANKLNVGNVFARRMAGTEASELNALAQMAGGKTQTSARGAAATQKSALEARLGPVREQELRAANIAGQKLPALEAQERAFGDVAAAKVEDVRRFTAAGERAAKREAEAGAIAVRSKGLMASQQADQYAHMGELAGAADRVAESAAQGSLLFGEARRFAKAAKNSLEAHGLRPLRADEAARSIDDMLADPRFAGSADVSRALTQVKTDLAAWTNADGVIDAFALDSIRKNSVNAAVRDALGVSPMSAKQQKRLTAELTASIKPLIVDAIERAGGTGYGQYLRDYASGLHTVSQRKMGAKLLKQYQSNPKKFQEIVRGDDPAMIEKTFGPGSYDIAAEMAPHMGTLRTISQRLERLDTIKDQAEKGRRGMELIAELNQSKLNLPNWLNPKVALTNAALQGLEKYTDPRTRKLLAEALQSGKSTQEILNKVPIAEQGRIFTLIGESVTKLEPFKVSTVGRSANALAPKEESVNALAPEDEE